MRNSGKLNRKATNAAIAAPTSMDIATGQARSLETSAEPYAPTPMMTTWASDHSPVSVNNR